AALLHGFPCFAPCLARTAGRESTPSIDALLQWGFARRVHSPDRRILMGMPMESWPRRHRITVDEYYRMAEVGLLAPDARVELIEGEIIDMPPIAPDHGSVVDRLTHLLVPAVGERAIVRVQGAVRLSRMSEPQPDVA